MAIRLGGRLELDGGTESVILPADASVDQSEVADLKKELEQAQQLGEAYARELASVFAAATEEPHGTTERAPSEEREHRFDQLVNTARGILRVLGPTLAHLREDAGLAESSPGSRGLHERLVQRTSVLAEVVGELRRVASTTLDEPTTNVALSALVREIAEAAGARAARHAVSLELEVADSIALSSRKGVLSLLVRALFDHAIAATPRNRSVTVRASRLRDGVALFVEDGGPQVPAASVGALLEHRIDPASLGRPVGLSLLIAQAAANQLGGTLTMSDAPNGRTSVTASWSAV
jgi:signal transduction histidine kinase